MNYELFIVFRSSFIVYAFMAVTPYMMPTEILYFAVNRWDSMVQREQYLMMGLSRTYRILFVDPPLSFRTILLGKIQGKKWMFKSCLQEVNDQLFVYTPPAFPPLSQYVEFMNSFNSRLLITLTRKVLGKLSFKNFIVGVGRPFLSPLIKAFNPKLSYYDCMDDYLEFPGLRANKKMLKKSEEALLKTVDLVFCSSQYLKKDKNHFNKNCFFIPNGVDLSSLQIDSSESEVPPDMMGIKKPILGYIGTIGERFDFDSLIGVAKAKPNWSIVLIGPLTSERFSSFFKGLSNIYWLGEKGYKELYKYLKIFDVSLIPFKVNEFTKRIYPTKLHQYFAVGKPVISSPLPDLKAFAPWVEFYSDAKEMEFKIEKTLSEDSKGKVLERKKIAAENTWERRVESIIQIFSTFPDKEMPLKPDG